MDATKRLLRNLPEHLLYFLAADVVCMLLTFAVNLIARPLLLEMARGDSAKEQTVKTILFAVFAVLFFVVLAVIFAKSPIQRTAYLSATIGREYSFASDLKTFLKGGLWIGVAAYGIFCLIPTFFLWLVPDIQYLPTLFYPQYALTELCGVWIAYAADLAAYLFFSLLLFPCLHLYWEKKRLYR
ncbi:MAG: hypothetical protein IJX47_05540 [Clostridia bacterium]|nr:hypothetical protein [Clostridia bacterium]